jgi:hypothetical protein
MNFSSQPTGEDVVVSNLAICESWKKLCQHLLASNSRACIGHDAVTDVRDGVALILQTVRIVNPRNILLLLSFERSSLGRVFSASIQRKVVK